MCRLYFHDANDTHAVRNEWAPRSSSVGLRMNFTHFWSNIHRNYESSERQNIPQPVKKQCILNWALRFDERLELPHSWSPLSLARYLRKRWYLLGSCLSSRLRPLPFPNDFVSEEVVIWPLWALIRLECLIRVTPPDLQQETGQCMCGCREELCTGRLRARWTVCVWVFMLAWTPKLWTGNDTRK